MFKYLNKLSRLLPLVKQINFSASPHHSNKFVLLSSAPKINLISSSKYSSKFTHKNSKIPPDLRGTFVQNFEELDEDQDGFLTIEENKQAVKRSLDFLTDRHIDTIFNINSTNKEYSLDQYLDHLGNIVNFKNSVDDSLHYLFLINDYDKDGKFHVEEVPKLMDVMLSSEDKIDKDKETASLLEYDEDEDDYVTFEELKKWLWAEHDPFKT